MNEDYRNSIVYVATYRVSGLTVNDVQSPYREFKFVLESDKKVYPSKNKAIKKIVQRPGKSD